MRISMLLTMILVIPNVSLAQSSQLQLKNSGAETIVMKYRPTSERPGQMTEVIIPPNKLVQISLTKNDPYDVSFYLKSKKTPQGRTQAFHAKAGNPIPLKSFSGEGAIDVRPIIAASRTPDGMVYQASGVTLASRNRNVKVYAHPSSASEFTKQVLKHRWQTGYKALDGRTYGANLDFEKLTFQAEDFAGRFTDLAIIEDRDGCHIVGRWSAMNSKGDVFFKVTKNNPRILEGEYTFDGNIKRHSWESQ